MTERLTIRDLIISTQVGTRIVGPIDLTLTAGRALTILGETGAGKSLIAQAILGNLPKGLSARGEIYLDGIRIDQMPPGKRSGLWGRRIALLPQEPWRALDPTMIAAAQVRETYHLVAGLTRRNAAVATQKDFESLGLGGAESKLPYMLSGGMAQRVAFAAARAGGAPILMADEPTKGLDRALRESVVRVLTASLSEGGGLLTITHDVAVAQALGGDLVVLRNGQVVESGPTDVVIGNPQSEYGRALVAADPALWPSCGSKVIGGQIILEAKDLTVARQGRVLLRNFNLALHAGERVAITGPSGCGKTSLVDTLAGILPARRGDVFHAADIGNLGIQKLYQDPPAAFAARIKLGTSLNDLAMRHRLPSGRIDTLMAQLHLPKSLLDRRPDEVSGGELQRLALARILALRPAVIFADEPTSRLDPVSQRSVMQVMSQVAEETHTAILLVTHNTEIAARWADRQIALETLEETHA